MQDKDSQHIIKNFDFSPVPRRRITPNLVNGSLFITFTAAFIASGAHLFTDGSIGIGTIFFVLAITFLLITITNK